MTFLWMILQLWFGLGFIVAGSQELRPLFADAVSVVMGYIFIVVGFMLLWFGMINSLESLLIIQGRFA